MRAKLRDGLYNKCIKEIDSRNGDYSSKYWFNNDFEVIMRKDDFGWTARTFVIINGQIMHLSLYVRDAEFEEIKTNKPLYNSPILGGWDIL